MTRLTKQKLMAAILARNSQRKLPGRVEWMTLV
jgi:hypothetical protein